MSTDTQTHEVSRAGAARILGVSMRTVDRYVKAGHLSRTRDVETGRVWLKRVEVNLIAAKMRATSG